MYPTILGVIEYSIGFTKADQRGGRVDRHDTRQYLIRVKSSDADSPTDFERSLNPLNAGPSPARPLAAEPRIAIGQYCSADLLSSSLFRLHFHQLRVGPFFFPPPSTESFSLALSCSLLFLLLSAYSFAMALAPFFGLGQKWRGIRRRESSRSRRHRVPWRIQFHQLLRRSREVCLFAACTRFRAEIIRVAGYSVCMGTWRLVLDIGYR